MKIKHVRLIEPPPTWARPEARGVRITTRTVDVWSTDNAPTDYRELSSKGPDPRGDRRADVQAELSKGNTVRVSEYYGASSRWPND